MDVAYVSALAALAGSVVGGLTSGITTWLSLRAQARIGQLAHELSQREALFKDFIVAASKAYGEAIMSNEPQIQELVALYAMISRMRVLATSRDPGARRTYAMISRMRVMSLPRTVACADEIMHATIDTYFAPNKTIRELNELRRVGRKSIR